jgi:hypothetical protein
MFYYRSFKDAACSSNHFAANNRMIMNDEFQRMWKEAVMTWYEVILRHSSGGTEENHRKSQDSRYSAEIWNLCLQNKKQELYAFGRDIRYGQFNVKRNYTFVFNFYINNLNFHELKQQVIRAQEISELFSQPKIFGEEVVSLLRDEPHL